MNDHLPPCPEAPAWRVSWDELDRAYPWLHRLAGCPQDPVHHAEGDVWIHTRMVCAALAGLPAWRELPEEERRIVFAAVLLHDVGKPDCTRIESDGRISSRGHSRRGSILARQILWRLRVPFAVRERVTALVRHHQVPYFLLERDDALRLCLEISQTARCDHLALLAEADVLGRSCADQCRLLDNISLFREYCAEQGCLSAPRAFASDHARFLCFLHPGRYPDAPAYEDFRAEVVLMSGLPGAGKDHYIRAHLADWPVVSLDAVRAELDIAPGDDQGAVLQRAREQARVHLRQGHSFVWNATNVSRQLRGESVRLFAGYNARIRIVYVEAPADVLFSQNRRRPAPVPETVLERLLDRWEVPDRTEAHQVEWVVRE
ncbi:MAG TPA: AAA family ATPase [Gemmataceae bacterium]|jgi:predicted kinase